MKRKSLKSKDVDSPLGKQRFSPPGSNYVFLVNYAHRAFEVNRSAKYRRIIHHDKCLIAAAANSFTTTPENPSPSYIHAACSS
jgi:hypothetical protein